MAGHQLAVTDDLGGAKMEKFGPRWAHFEHTSLAICQRIVVMGQI